MQQDMPDFLPDRLEAGTHNMPGIAGLLAGLRFVQRTGLKTIPGQERAVAAAAAAELRRLPGVTVYASEGFLHQTGVLSFCVEGRDCEEVGELLALRGIAVRSGLHCAPLAHRTAGTLPGGTVRLSVSVFNTLGQAERFADGVRRICS